MLSITVSPKTNWVSLGQTDNCGQQQNGLPMRINRPRASGLELPTPPGGANDPFSYRLTLKRLDAPSNGRRAQAPYVQEGTVVRTGNVRLGARAREDTAPDPRRWVYVLAIEWAAKGFCSILAPAKEITARTGARRQPGGPAEIDLSGKGGEFTIGTPFGVDTYICSRHGDQIADLSAFTFSGVWQGARGGPQSPLTQLLGNATPIRAA